VSSQATTYNRIMKSFVKTQTTAQNIDYQSFVKTQKTAEEKFNGLKSVVQFLTGITSDVFFSHQKVE
jgi:hypothetical protein